MRDNTMFRFWHNKNGLAYQQSYKTLPMQLFPDLILVLPGEAFLLRGHVVGCKRICLRIRLENYRQKVELKLAVEISMDA